MKGRIRVRAVTASLVMVALALTACAPPGTTDGTTAVDAVPSGQPQVQAPSLDAPAQPGASSVPAAEAETAIHPALGDIHTRTRDGMTMVYVPAGQFEMGSSDAELEAAMRACVQASGQEQNCQRDKYRDEQPAHAVSLYAFWIDSTEVTNAQFSAFLNDRGNQVEEGVSWLEPGAGHRGVEYGQIEEVDGVFRPWEEYENYPVVEVSWYGASAYCSWVGGRLPTEAEWEYAARGPERTVYPWGDEFIHSALNYSDTGFFAGGEVRWMPVGSFPEGASWCGALDMAGNIWEWVSDWWSAGYYAASPRENPQGPDSGDVRVGRGGSWYDDPWHVRSAFRKGLSPSSYRIHWIGFRCALPAPLP